MALGLERNIAPAELHVPAFDQLPGVGVAVVQLRLLVFQDELAVDEVLDGPISMDFHLGGVEASGSRPESTNLKGFYRL